MKLARIALLISMALFLAGARLPGMPAVQYPTGSMINYDFQPSATAGIWSVSHAYGNASLSFTLGDAFSGSLYECDNPQPDTNGNALLSDEAGCSLLAPLTASTKIASMKSTRSWYVVQVDQAESSGNASRLTIKGGYEDVASGDAALSVAAGESPSKFWVHKFGYNGNVGTAGETVWSASVPYTGFPTTSHSVEVFSSAAADTGAGVLATGARGVVIHGLDENFNPQTSDPVPLVGTFRVSVPGTWTRINRVYVTNVDGDENGTCAADLIRPSATGVMCANVGNITVETVDTNHIMARISAGQGQTEMALYTVPAGHTAYLKNILVTSGGTTSRKGADVFMYQRQNVDDAVTPSARRVVWRAEELTGNTIQEDFGYTVSFPEKTDIWFGGTEVGGGAGTASVTATFDLLLVDD